MANDPTPSEVQIRLWRRSLLVGVALLAVYLPLDLHLPEGHRAVAWRVAWMLALMGTAALQRTRWPRLGAWALQIAIVASGFGGIAVVAHGGGTQGARFGFLLAFPLTGLVLFPEFPVAVGALGATCLAGGLALIARDGRDAWFVLEWGVLSFALTALAVVGSVGFRRLRLSEVRAQRSSALALEQLADSERRRAQAEQLALVGRLAAGVAHEINNPLSYVKANVHFVRDEALSPDGRQALDEALQGIDRIGQIVTDMRGLARDGQEPPAIFSADEALSEAWRLASVRLATVQASWSATPGLPQVQGIRRFLVQALLNLAANAADAADSASDPDRRWVTARAYPAAGGVAIDVDDGGPGLTAEVAAHLFEPFVSTKGTKGTGLGLALVREHVARCGGTVEGGNRCGGGARFTIRLPAAGAPAVPGCRPAGHEIEPSTISA
jgi:signal transduction histidine kinase